MKRIVWNIGVGILALLDRLTHPGVYQVDEERDA